MTVTTLTREAVNDVMRKHNDGWPADTDFSPTAVRQYARYLRFAASDSNADYNDNMIEAAELDLLVDRSEPDR